MRTRVLVVVVIVSLISSNMVFLTIVGEKLKLISDLKMCVKKHSMFLQQPSCIACECCSKEHYPALDFHGLQSLSTSELGNLKPSSLLLSRTLQINNHMDVLLVHCDFRLYPSNNVPIWNGSLHLLGSP